MPPLHWVFFSLSLRCKVSKEACHHPHRHIWGLVLTMPSTTPRYGSEESSCSQIFFALLDKLLETVTGYHNGRLLFYFCRGVLLGTVPNQTSWNRKLHFSYAAIDLNSWHSCGKRAKQSTFYQSTCWVTWQRLHVSEHVQRQRLYYMETGICTPCYTSFYMALYRKSWGCSY